MEPVVHHCTLSVYHGTKCGRSTQNSIGVAVGCYLPALGALIRVLLVVLKYAAALDIDDLSQISSNTAVSSCPASPEYSSTAFLHYFYLSHPTLFPRQPNRCWYSNPLFVNPSSSICTQPTRNIIHPAHALCTNFSYRYHPANPGHPLHWFTSFQTPALS